MTLLYSTLVLQAGGTSRGGDSPLNSQEGQAIGEDGQRCTAEGPAREGGSLLTEVLHRFLGVDATSEGSNGLASETVALVSDQQDSAPATVEALPSWEPTANSREHLAIIVLFEKKAFDYESRIPIETIAKEAASTGRDNFSEVMAKLKSHGITASKVGRGGGCWLTERGRSLAARLA